MAQALGQPQAQPQMRLRAGTTQTARPMSWHPVATNDGNMDMNWQTMSAYSSPMSMEYQMMAQQSQMGVPNYIQQQPAPILSTPNYSPIEQQQLQYAQNMYALSHAHPQPMNTFVPSQPVTPSLFPTQSFPMQESYAPYPYNNLVETNVTPQDWSLYNTLDVPSQFFSNVTSRTGSASTAPPTPESFPNYDAPKCLEQEKEWNIEVDDEDDSEVLVGMGLYDEPEKKGEDCVIEYGPVVSRFGREDKPQGKGLKLEETWEPPATEDDEEEGGEQDAEGEEEENVPEQQAVQSVNVPTAQQVQLLQQQQQMQMLYGFGQGQMPEQVAGWV